MIQRIQTVYLLLSVLSTALMFFLPVWTHSASIDEVTIGSVGAGTHIVLLLIWVIMLLVQFITIFFFKHRKRQMSFCQLGILLNVLFILTAFVFIYEERSNIDDFSISNFKIGSFLPLASTIFLFLANKNIRKDEELVKSMDRLR